MKKQKKQNKKNKTKKKKKRIVIMHSNQYRNKLNNDLSKIRTNKMFCVSFVLMKMKSHFNFTFAFNLIFAVISYCFKYLYLFSDKIVTNES